jgi:hypothetical protein
MKADSVRRKWHTEGIVSHIIDRNINYTNFCTEYCSFCAFYRPMGHAEGYMPSVPSDAVPDRTTPNALLPRMVRKLDLLEFALVRNRRSEARDNELTRCRESWIRSGSC